MEYKDYYQIMGVERGATQDEIKRAYRKLARKYHPDVSKDANAEKRFKEVGEAYEVLKDPEKRAAYDNLGSNWRAGEDFEPPPDWNAGFEFRGGGFTDADQSHFSDFFEQLYGRAAADAFRTRRRPGAADFGLAGEDHHARILVDLEDAFNGAERVISLNLPEFTARGEMINREHRLNVKIPPGVVSGQRIRLRGQGGVGYGDAPAGDLYLEVGFAQHPLFTTQQRDVYLDLPITPWEAALGETIAIPTLGGKVDLKIPAGTQNGSKLRLKGRGLPGKVPGDQYVTLKIQTPKAKTDADRALYQKMKQQMNFNPRSRMGV